ncbi:MAG: hypothetical protein ACRDT4_26630, partial [Micromonosporaceae bacterium]
PAPRRRRPGPRPGPRPGAEPAPPSAAESGPLTRGGLTRRVPGANLGATANPRRRMEEPVLPQYSTLSRDPERERASLDAYASAVARAAAETEAGQDHQEGSPQTTPRTGDDAWSAGAHEGNRG